MHTQMFLCLCFNVTACIQSNPIQLYLEGTLKTTSLTKVLSSNKKKKTEMTVRNHTLSRQRNIYKNKNKINTYNEKRKDENNEYILNIKT